MADRVKSWRLKQLQGLVTKALEMKATLENLHAHPRVIHAIIEYGSWAEEDVLQNMWAGLLASSCTPDGTDDSNMIFIQILSQLTRTEVMLLDFLCRDGKKYLSRAERVHVSFQTDIHDLSDFIGDKDGYRIFRELDHLESLRLIEGWGRSNSQIGILSLTITSLGLQLYIRGQGSTENPTTYFHLET